MNFGKLESKLILEWAQNYLEQWSMEDDDGDGKIIRNLELAKCICDRFKK